MARYETSHDGDAFAMPVLNGLAIRPAFAPVGFDSESPFMGSTLWSLVSGKDEVSPHEVGRDLVPRSHSHSHSHGRSHWHGHGHEHEHGHSYGHAHTHGHGHTSVNHGVTLATGDRFSQLLEAKLNLDHQDPAPTHSTFPDTFPSDRRTPSLHEWANHSSDRTSSTPFGPISPLPMDQLTIETALRDFSQVQIPPDWVAPAPPLQHTWENDPTYQALRAANSGESCQQDFTHLPWTFNPIPMASPSTYTHTTPLRQRQTNKVNPVPPSGVLWNTLQTLPSAQPTNQPLPPLLKIRVHDAPLPDALRNPSCTPGPSPPHHISANAANQPPRPGAWAFELLNPSTKKQDEHSIWSRPGPLPPTHVKPPPMSRLINRLPSFVSKQPSHSPVVNRPLFSPTSDRDRDVPTGMPELSAPKSMSPVPKMQGKRKRKDVAMSKVKEKLIAETEGDKKIVIACNMCRARKLKCDGMRPRCHNCTRRDEEECKYDEVLRRRGPGKKGTQGPTGSGSEEGGSEEPSVLGAGSQVSVVVTSVGGSDRVGGRGAESQGAESRTFESILSVTAAG